MENGTTFLHRAMEKAQLKPPVWLMRQAGRYLPEYRETRTKAGDFVSLCLNPELASEVTLQPIHRFDFDAAIIFSDILMVPYGLNQKLWFEEGEGPKLGEADWQDFDVEKLKPVYAAIRLTRENLASEKSLIGFAGAPWTLLLYCLQGGSGDQFETARHFVGQHPAKALEMVETLADAALVHLIHQIDAGCDTVQIFDSWAGLCPADLQENFIVRPAQRMVQILKSARPHVKIIAFPKGFKDLGTYRAEVAPDVLGIDQFTALDAVAGPVQGNLDPLALLEGGMALDRGVKTILDTMQGGRHIFNLGHGVDKNTPIGHVEQLVRLVRS